MVFIRALQRFLRRAARGEANRCAFFFPLDPYLFPGRPDYQVQRPPTFLAREGLRPCCYRKSASAARAFREIRIKRGREPLLSAFRHVYYAGHTVTT